MLSLLEPEASTSVRQQSCSQFVSSGSLCCKGVLDTCPSRKAFVEQGHYFCAWFLRGFCLVGRKMICSLTGSINIYFTLSIVVPSSRLQNLLKSSSCYSSVTHSSGLPVIQITMIAQQKMAPRSFTGKVVHKFTLSTGRTKTARTDVTGQS